MDPAETKTSQRRWKRVLILVSKTYKLVQNGSRSDLKL